MVQTGERRFYGNILLTKGVVPPDTAAMIRVDAHHHVWRVSRGDYGWLTPDLPIHRDYTLDDLRPLLGDITATVLVQAAPTEAETAFMLDVAREFVGPGARGGRLDRFHTKRRR